jgi:hypothetical protein
MGSNIVEQGSLMHERLWLSVEAKRLDGESARLWTTLPGLGAGTERRKRHGKGDVAPGKVCSGPGMRVDMQPSSIEKSSRMQACRGPPVLSGTASWSPIPREGERCLQ